MAWLDEHLQRRRIAATLPWIPFGSRVLDVGCADGALFRIAGSRIASGVGIDTRTGDGWSDSRYERRVGEFPDSLGENETFDVVVMLAVVEHISDYELRKWGAAVPKILSPQGRLIITTPSPMVDHILHLGIKLRMLDGMEAHQHHGFDPTQVPSIFSVPGISLQQWSRFEIRLNHLFVLSAENEHQHSH